MVVLVAQGRWEEVWGSRQSEIIFCMVFYSFVCILSLVSEIFPSIFLSVVIEGQTVAFCECKYDASSKSVSSSANVHRLTSY